jgi:phage/plasmid-associated DNA primase
MNFKTALKEQNDYSFALYLKEILPLNIICYDINNMKALYFDDVSTLYKDITINELVPTARKLLKDSITNKMKNIDLDDIKKYSTMLNKVGDINFMKNVIKSLFTECYDQKAYEEMNINPYVANFKNGLVDLRDGKFRKRTKDDKYTVALHYDFEQKDNKETMNEIKNILKPVCNNSDEMMDFIFSYFGYALTGITNLEKFFYLYGATASNGKSTVLNLFRYAFPIYFKELAQDTFEIDSKDRHKHMAGLKGIRCAIVEESDRKKLDVNFIKKFVTGGQLENKVMFGTTETINLISKLIFISNNLPAFHNDQGFERRIIMGEFKNKFVDEQDYKPNVKGIYKKDKTYLDKFKDPKYSLAFFKLLLPYCIDVLKTLQLKNEQKINQAKDICEDNDKMKQFIEATFERKNNNEDRIAKTSFLNAYRTFAEMPHVSFMNILNDIKRLGIEYARTLRLNNEKGCILGLKWRFEDDDEDYDIQSENDFEKEQLKKENRELKQQNEEIMKQLQELKQMMEELKQEKEHVKPKVNEKIDIVEESDTEEDKELLKKIAELKAKPTPPPKKGRKAKKTKVVDDSDSDNDLVIDSKKDAKTVIKLFSS